MRELGLVFVFVFVLSGMAAIMASLYFAIQAAKLRSPKYSFLRAISTPALLLEDYVYAAEAWPLRKRALLYVPAAFLFWLIGAVVGVSTGALH